MFLFLQDAFLQKSILMGIVFGLVNFWLLSQVVTGFITSQQTQDPQNLKDQKKKLIKTITLLIGKMIFLFATIALLVGKHHVSPLAFLGGFTISLLVAIPFKLLKGNPHA